MTFRSKLSILDYTLLLFPFTDSKIQAGIIPRNLQQWGQKCQQLHNVQYLRPMMNPNTMKTRMMVPATATTAMIMTGFCSLETAVATNRAKS